MRASYGWAMFSLSEWTAHWASQYMPVGGIAIIPVQYRGTQLRNLSYNWGYFLEGMFLMTLAICLHRSSAVLNQKEEGNLWQHWTDFDPYNLWPLTLMLVGSSMFLLWCFEATLAIWVRGLLNARTRKITHRRWDSNLRVIDCSCGLLSIELSWPPSYKIFERQ